MNFYNDNDPDNCAWLRNLIDAGLIPPGRVDDRSIADISPGELLEYRQCHFFAGIGGWPLALRLAGVPDDEPLDSGSCPCQPFSQTGKRRGFADERHLFPVFRDLIAFRETPVVIGEQVASKDGRIWLDRVSSDLEALGFAFGASDLCSAGVGSPNIRQRLYWVANRHDERRQKRAQQDRRAQQPQLDASRRPDAVRCSVAGGLANADSGERDGLADGEKRECNGAAAGREQSHRKPQCGGAIGWLGHANDAGRQGRQFRGHGGGERAAWQAGLGMWSAYELVACADRKQRRIEPGSFPLAHGIPSRVGPLLTALRAMGNRAIKAARANRNLRLHAYGNAINVAVAAEFIGALRDDGILS